MDAVAGNAAGVIGQRVGEQGPLPIAESRSGQGASGDSPGGLTIDGGLDVDILGDVIRAAMASESPGADILGLPSNVIVRLNIRVRNTDGKSGVAQLRQIDVRLVTLCRGCGVAT